LTTPDDRSKRLWVRVVVAVVGGLLGVLPMIAFVVVGVTADDSTPAPPVSTAMCVPY
jgi:hypothetical protein